ncbi:hypothetical protein [Chenggangzhangella methanolivorans]|uniref:Uncharacterized protein n=1 Tax=Chenggangzhangella methanolivorans TaxID=1437009 RepID=A0A9E6RHI5_9HYPH|nr:hypothetical protein [Chenggangzhangella methanolivorans]QZO01132.1 hypothetical protein K6K41_06145 [Chenggangzhangella methanolivorans]
MSYTVIAAAESGPVATVASSVLDALRLVQDLEKDGDQVTIASDTGWILTVEELEALAKP